MSRLVSKFVSGSLAVFLTLVAALAAVMIFPDQILSPSAYLDYRSCLDVVVGNSDADVTALMGEPHSRAFLPSGELLLMYDTQKTGDGPVAIAMKRRGDTFIVDSTACHGLE